MGYTCDECGREYAHSDSLTRHINNKGHYPDDWTECSCGDHFKFIGNHWQGYPDHRPSFTDRQLDIIRGMLMSDGYLDSPTDGRNPLLQIRMTTPEYLEYLDQEFGVLSNEYRIDMTAEENAERNRQTGFDVNAKAENYQDTYRLTTKRHPELKVFSSWYDSGKKIWPCDEIELTPTVLTHLYCGDGTLAPDYCGISIAMSNELDRIDKVKDMFRRKGFDPSRVDVSDRERGGKRVSMYFNAETSREMFDYMDEAPPGFSYKFPDE